MSATDSKSTAELGNSLAQANEMKHVVRSRSGRHDRRAAPILPVLLREIDSDGRVSSVAGRPARSHLHFTSSDTQCDEHRETLARTLVSITFIGARECL